MECCKASNDAGARIWQAADVGYLALQYGAWLTWACLTLQLSSHLVPLLLQESSHLVPLLLQESSHLVPLLSQESSLHFLSFLLKLFWFTCYSLVYCTNYNRYHLMVCICRWKLAQWYHRRHTDRDTNWDGFLEWRHFH